MTFYLSLRVLGEQQPLSRVNEWLQYRSVPLNKWDDTHGDQQDAKFDGGSSPTAKLSGHIYSTVQMRCAPLEVRPLGSTSIRTAGHKHKTRTKQTPDKARLSRGHHNPDLMICQGSNKIISLYRNSRYNDMAVKQPKNIVILGYT